jgi:hypothetical protein
MEPDHVSGHRRGTARCPMNASRRHALRTSTTRTSSSACVDGGRRLAAQRSTDAGGNRTATVRGAGRSEPGRFASGDIAGPADQSSTACCLNLRAERDSHAWSGGLSRRRPLPRERRWHAVRV